MVPFPAEELLSLLSSEEQERYFGFELDGRRLEFLWSRLLLRHALTPYLGKDPWNFPFEHKKNGKPFLEHSKIQFNLSHTEGLIACSVSLREVGIDVEKVTGHGCGGRDWRLLGERYFTTAEKDYLLSQDSDQQARIFYRIFTLKEAILKADGKGLSGSLRDFSVPLPLREKSSLGPWECRTKFLEPGGFCLAHAAENRCGPPLEYRNWNWEAPTFAKLLLSRSPTSIK